MKAELQGAFPERAAPMGFKVAMGKYCFSCHRERPNEAFSGRGHSIGICKKCGRMPEAGRRRILDEEFLYHVLEQRHISPKNVEHFKEMALRYSDELGEKAALMAELGEVHPRKKKRYGFLYHNKRELYDRMERLNLIENLMAAYAAEADEEERVADEIDFRVENQEKDALRCVVCDEEDIPF